MQSIMLFLGKTGQKCVIDDTKFIAYVLWYDTSFIIEKNHRSFMALLCGQFYILTRVCEYREHVFIDPLPTLRVYINQTVFAVSNRSITSFAYQLLNFAETLPIVERHQLMLGRSNRGRALIKDSFGTTVYDYLYVAVLL